MKIFIQNYYFDIIINHIRLKLMKSISELFILISELMKFNFRNNDINFKMIIVSLSSLIKKTNKQSLLGESFITLKPYYIVSIIY